MPLLSFGRQRPLRLAIHSDRSSAERPRKSTHVIPLAWTRTMTMLPQCLHRPTVPAPAGRTPTRRPCSLPHSLRRSPSRLSSLRQRRRKASRQSRCRRALPSAEPTYHLSRLDGARPASGTLSELDAEHPLLLLELPQDLDQDIL